jgi:hypothetical protein
MFARLARLRPALAFYKHGCGDGNNLYSRKLTGYESWTDFKAPPTVQIFDLASSDACSGLVFI